MSLLLALALQAAAPIAQQPVTPASRWAAQTREADFTARDVRFASGDRAREVRIHYATLGTPHRDATGAIDNAVMILHGTGGSGRQFLSPQFADALYGPGRPLDLARYFIILPDNIGHGRSSKPSDGLRMRFPRYDYADMVALQHRLLTEGLGVRSLRLLIGTSMGCMHGFVWGGAHPGFARALMPLACQPVQIAGLNRMWRQLLVDGIKADPAWRGGDYTAQPAAGLRQAAAISVIAGAAPLNLQRDYPTRDAAEAAARDRVARDMATRDANDMIYQFESSRTYDPWPALEKITVPVMWINSADDFINPRGFDHRAAALKRMPNARYRLIPETADTRGHGTHSWAVNWTADLIELLKRSE